MDTKSSDFLSIIPPLQDLARKAGREILKVYTQEFDIELKGDNSPLTRADKMSNAVICRGLEQLAPDIPIISEENRDIPFAERKSFRLFWLVDPLDGTKEFIKHNGEFTVNIALVRDGSPVLGIVYVPVSGELYWGVANMGAFVVRDGQERQISVAEFSMRDSHLGVVCSRSHMNEATEKFIDQLHEPETVSKGSSSKFMIVAEGKAHLYPRVAPTMEWDTGAAQAILEAAGGKVLRYGTTQPLIYNKEDLRNPFFLALGKEV